MESGKTIHVIHAADAAQHLGKFNRILETLKSEKRFDDVVTYESDFIDQNSFKDIGPKDGIVIFLTDGIANKKPEIEEIVLRAHTREPDVKAIEIIVDNLTFEPQFIALPKSLEPVRASEDMDAVWQEIGEDLRALFTARTTVSNWLKYAVGVLVIGVVAYFVGPTIFDGKEPQPDFSYRVLDPIVGDVVTNAEECYLPCRVFLNDRSKNADGVKWELGDTIIVDQREPEYVIDVPGELKMRLIASKGNKERDSIKSILIKAPPQATFDIKNSGCTAPCDIVLTNTSGYDTDFKWKFTNGTSPAEVTNKTIVTRNYQNAGEFLVELHIENEEGVKASAVDTITIQKDHSPYAEFSAVKTAGVFTNEQTFKFTNLSKNGVTYVWDFGDGSNPHPTTSTNPVSHKFKGYDAYAVTLKVVAADGTSIEAVKPIYVRRKFNFADIPAYKLNINRDVYKINVPSN